MSDQELDKKHENGEPQDEAARDDGAQDDRAFSRLENLALFGGFIALAALGVWLLMTMAEVRRVQDCAAQGRRNCEIIDKGLSVR